MERLLRCRAVADYGQLAGALERWYALAVLRSCSCGLLTASVLLACGGVERRYNESSGVSGSETAGGDGSVEFSDSNAAQSSTLDVTLQPPEDGVSAPTDGDAAVQNPEVDTPDPSSTVVSDAALLTDAAVVSEGELTTGDGSISDVGASTPDDTADANHACRPAGEEQCFNQLDDDCNGYTDCADPACSVVATCERTGETQGVLVAATEDCPAGYEQQFVELHQGLDAPGCAGCTCTPSATLCMGELYFYPDATACEADTMPLIGGTLAAPVTDQCPATPHLEGFTSGYRVGQVTRLEGTGTCTPSGVPTLGTPLWLTSMKYCIADAVGSGCQFGHACVPTTATGTACTESADMCPSDSIASTWYQGYVDARSCDVCSCDGNGSCDGVGVRLGSDWACEVDNPVSLAGEKRCDVTPYSPPAMLGGATIQPSCQPNAQLSGSVTPIDERTLCCAE